MHLWAHLQGGEAMGRCSFRATRPGGCRSGDHIHEAVTASPRTRPKRSPQGHGLLPNQQRTDALRPVSEPRSLRRLGSGRSRLQDDHRATTEAVGNALDSQPRQRNYCPSLFPAQWPLGRILGTTRRWLISGRFFTYKFGAHPLKARCDLQQGYACSQYSREAQLWFKLQENWSRTHVKIQLSSGEPKTNRSAQLRPDHFLIRDLPALSWRKTCDCRGKSFQSNFQIPYPTKRVKTSEGP